MSQASSRSSAVAPLLAGSSLHTHYGQSHILHAVSLAIAPGEAIGLMGRNGMGKTTLIRTLLGLVRPTSGDILIDGVSANAMTVAERARCGIALVPEGRGIFASLRVLENLTFAARPPTSGDGWTLERVLTTFPRLAERLDHQGDQLSGGEQQMLAIGRALMTNPRLLVLDEATEGLAPLVRDEIWRTIKEIRKTGIATLIVDKTVEAVTDAVDRIVILVKGEIVYDDTSAAFAADPAIMHRYLGV